MKRLGLLLGLVLGLVAPALAVVSTTIVNNAAYTILGTDVRVVTGPTAFTASRTWTLPQAGQTCIGQTCSTAALLLLDSGSAITLAFPLVVAPSSGDTINGSTSSLTITQVGARVNLVPTSPSNWQTVIESPTQTGWAGTAPTVFHSGGVAPVVAACCTDKTATNTETYIVEVQIPVQTTLTGVSIIGTASSTGNVQISLADSTGAIITAAQTASTAATAAAAFQQVPFAATYVAKPGKYYILLQNSSSSNHFEAHTVGNFGASKKTSEVYGTFTAITPPTTFTTAVGPVADTY